MPILMQTNKKITEKYFSAILFNPVKESFLINVI